MSLFAANLSWSADDTKKSFDIPADQAARSLKAFAQQAGVEVLIQADLGRNTRTLPVKGEMTTQQAIDALLADTGLVASHDAKTGVYAVRKETPIEVKNGQSRPASDQAATGEMEEGVLKLPAFTVTGDKTINADIPRTRDDAQPYVVYDRITIERSGASSMGDFLKTRLPMNSVAANNSQITETTSLGVGAELGNQSSINLRGLGVNQTLILVDGRRMPGVNIGNGSGSAFGAAGFGQPDINGIPLSLVERIEVLPSTASGIYGGGATGGVINLITRKDYVGAELRLTYANTFDSDAAERRVDFNAGFSLEGGRTQVRISASHQDANALLIGDRDFAIRGRLLNLANNPADFLGLNPPPFSYLSNIRSQNGSNLVLKNGTALNSPITFVPAGYAGPQTDNGAALVPNAGQYSVDLPQSLLGARQNVLNNPIIESATFNLRRSFGEKVNAFLDIAWLQNHGRMFAALVPNLVALGPTHAHNPFTTTIFVRFPATDLMYPMDSNSETLRGTGGFTIQLPHDWTMTAEHGWSRSRFTYRYTSPAVGDPDGSGPLKGINDAFNDATLNVMRDLNVFPLDYTPYLFSSPNRLYGPADTILNNTTVRASGSGFSLPGGAATFSGLVERRQEDASEVLIDDVSPLNVLSVRLTSGRAQTVDSYYAEGNFPIFGPANARRWVRSLDLQASVRHDRYETEAASPVTAILATRDSARPAFTYARTAMDATKFTIGLKYAPTQDLALRASFGNGFLPPSIHQIVARQAVSSIGGVIDPKRGSVPTPLFNLPQTQGGNPDLLPEESESTSAGLILTPRILPGFRLSLDYTRIEKENEISALGINEILFLENVYTERVTRAPLTASDQASGFTGGVITNIDLSLVNFAYTKLEAFDLQCDYTFKTASWGDLNVYAIATRTMEFKKQAVPQVPITEYVGFNAGPLKWRGNIGLNWTRGPWTAGWNAQYYDSHFVYFAQGQSATGIASAILRQGSDTIPSQIYHDVSVRYQFGAGNSKIGRVLSKSDLTVGVQNVFEKHPPILATVGSSGGYSQYGDPRLRRYTVSFRRSF